MKFVSEEQLIPGQTYMIYYPQTKTEPSIGNFIRKSGALEFMVNGRILSILSKHDEDNLEPEEEYSPIVGFPTLEQLSYRIITTSRRTKADKHNIKKTFGTGRKRTRRRKGPTRV